MDILQKIITHKIEEVKLRKQKRPLASFMHEIKKSERDFKKTISTHDRNTPRLIAELKAASPSEGILRENLESELEDIVRIYNKYASAISVVTDEKFFNGSLEWIQKIRLLTHLPILCKDFIIDEYQLYEARKYGADAILLIAAALNETRLKKFLKIAGMLGTISLVEVHSHDEIKTALSAGAKIIGINNRELKTFRVSLDTTLDLAQFIPKDVVSVSESGFRAKEDIQKVNTSVDAVLIGTSLMKAKNIQRQLEMLEFSPQLNSRRL